jgi:hypothetical protein
MAEFRIPMGLGARKMNKPWQGPASPKKSVLGLFLSFLEKDLSPHNPKFSLSQALCLAKPETMTNESAF